MDATISVVCYKSKTLSNGEHPLMLRISKDGKKKYQSLGISVNPKFWDFQKNKPKPKCPNLEYLQKIILDKKLELQKKKLEIKSDQKEYSAATLLEANANLLVAKTVDCFYKEIIAQCEINNKCGNRLVYLNSYNSLKRFTNGKLEIPFNSINVAWLEKYEKWLRSNGNKETTISLMFRTLRSTYNKAIKERCAHLSDYPFQEYKISKFDTSTQKRAIAKTDMLKFTETSQPIGQKKYVELSKDIFIFSYLCGGINFTDIANLTQENIVNGRLHYIRQKTGKLIKIGIPQEAMQIIKKYTDIIVTQVFQYYSSEPSDDLLATEKKAIKGIFRYIYYKDRPNFFKNTTKILHRVKNCSVNAPELQQYIINDVVSRIYKNEQTLYTSKELGTNPEGVSIDWVDAYIGNIANFAPTNAEAIHIWKLTKKYNRRELNVLRWLLPRLQTQQDKDIVHKDLLNEQGQMQDKYIENSYIEFQTELVRFLDMDEAKEIYLNASFIYEASPSADDDDIDDFFSDSAESAHGQESNNETYLTELKEKRIRNFARQLMHKAQTLADIHDIKNFLQKNDKGVVPHDDAVFFFNFIAPYTWLEVFKRFSQPEELVAFFNELTELSVDKKEDTSMFLNKTEVLNGALENIPSSYAYDLWNRMGNNCDGYSLNFMLQKAKNFEQAKGIFNTFMERLEQQEEENKTKLKVGEIYLNDLLDTTSTYSGIKECEELFHKYHLLEADQSLLDYPSQHTQGILYQRMTLKEIKAHMKRHRPQNGDESRNIRTIVQFILKISNYEEAYQALFGETPDCITPEEQQILNHSPYVVSEMFNKVKTPEEGGVARDFFENRLDKSLLNHPDANILNIIINNRFIYPYYEQKVDMIKRMSEKYTVQQNSYTHKHLLYHLTNHTQDSLPPEEIQLIINEEIMKSLDAPKDVLKQMLIQRYYAGRAQDNVPQPFPIYTSEGWKIKESTILEYVYCLLDVGVYDGGIIFCCMKALLRQNDKENAQRLQEQAINKKVFINYDSYCMLKKLGAVIPKPYLFVEHYPIMKDICYQMRERGMTFEEAESRIKEMEDDLHISIARTQIYWNNVISRMANNRTNKKLVLQNTLKFIDEHHVPMSPEIYYSLLHTITSIEDYTKVKGLYKGELNIGHIFVLLKKIPEFAKYRIAEWAFVACLRQEFDEWYDILCSISEKEQEKRIKIMLQSERYKQLQVITPKGYLNQTFLFWWTIRYAVSETEEQRKAELDTLVTMIPNPFVPQYPKMIEKFFIPYPQDLLEIIREYIGRIISSEPQ